MQYAFLSPLAIYDFYHQLNAEEMNLVYVNKIGVCINFYSKNGTLSGY